MQITGSAPEHETYDQTSNYIIIHIFYKKKILDTQVCADKCTFKSGTFFESN